MTRPLMAVTITLASWLMPVVGAASEAGSVPQALEAHRGKDFARAWSLAIPPALDGDATAQYVIGIMLYNGLGTAQDRCLATLWFDKAARSGHIEAQYRLAMAYVWGYGVPRIDEMAHMWLTIATRAGHAPSREALAVVTARIPPERRKPTYWLISRLSKVAERDYMPVPDVLLEDRTSNARNWFSPCRGPEPDSLPPRRDEQLVGLPSIEDGLEALQNGDYLLAFDELLAGARFFDGKAIDILTTLTLTGWVGPADRCRAMLLAQNGRWLVRPMAYLAHAYAQGWGVKRDSEKAYMWALWVHREEPSAIDIRQFEPAVPPERRMAISDTLIELLKKRLHSDSTFIIPDDIRQANPDATPGLAPCVESQ